MGKYNTSSEVKGLRKGFTMIELVFVIIILAVLAAISIPKIMNNSSKSEISGVLGSDTESIYQAMNEWRGSGSGTDGTFANLTTSGLGAYLPNSMSLVDPDGTPNSGDEYITSSGFNGAIHYKIASDTSVSTGDSVKFFADMTLVKNSQNWGDSLVQYAENKVTSLMVKYSSNPTVAGAPANIAAGVVATSLGAANAAFSGGGTSSDGLVGLRKIGS